MSVWLAIPSKRPVEELVPWMEKWWDMGYLIALLRDPGEVVACDLCLEWEYPGYGASVNRLVRHIFGGKVAQWVVTGGDDTFPDPNVKAKEIARQCEEHFKGTFGVMQPTGDGHGIDTICGSPWLGREFCQRAYGGNGPYWEEYKHQFDDQELQHVALKLGILWQRPDLTHEHQHWSWTTGVCPEHMKPVNSPEHWERVKSLYEFRARNGFPGHEPLPVS